LTSATAALVNVAQNTLVSGRDAQRWGNAHPNLCPYQLFEASDGAVAVAVGSDAHWIACANALELGELANDPALRTNAGRLAHRDRIVAAMHARILTMRAADVLAALDGAEVPCGRVKSVREALHAVDASALHGVLPPLPGRVRFAPPHLDEHGTLVRTHGWNAFPALAGVTDAH
jgi:crotonobetainyl-CoA:carnitine CoA-transferase CaiB-like acyl-CoA transferase